MNSVNEKFKAIEDWQEYLNQVNPNIMKLGLDRVKAVAEKLEVDRFDNSKIITVAGTNGKGSTATMLAKILDNSGIRTGLYTSPHILRFSERIVCNGVEVSDDELCLAFEKVYEAQDQNDPLTFFEFTTLAALVIFKENLCEVLVLEVGLGGRLDATNILDADIVIIPSIGLDHCAILGNSIESIAEEKAGVIKSGTIATILGFLPKEAYKVIEEHVNKYKGVIHSLDKNIKVKWTGEHDFDLLAPIELKDLHVPNLPLINAPLSTIAALLMRIVFKFDIRDEAIRSGLEFATLNGRFQTLSKHPRVIIDVAHNPPASWYLHSCIESLGKRRRYALIGMLKDKDIEKTIANIAEDFEKFYVTTLDTQRGAKKEILVKALQKCGISRDKIIAFDEPEYAYEIARVEQDEDVDLYIFGSFVTVEAVLKYEKKRTQTNH